MSNPGQIIVNPRGIPVVVEKSRVADLMKKGYSLVETVKTTRVKKGPIRLAFVSILRGTGGAQKWAADAATYLHENGFDVRFFTTDEESPWYLSCPVQLARPWDSANISKAVKAFDPDIIFFNEFTNTLYLKDYTAREDPLKVAIYHGGVTENFVKHDVDAHVFVNYLGKTLPDNAAIIPCGLNVSEFKAKKHSRSAGKAKPLTVGYIGRIDSNKLPIDYVDGLSKFKDKRFRFEIVGFGLKNQEKYEAKIKDRLGKKRNVKLVDAIPNEDVPKKLRDFDIFIIPSEMEGCPFSLIEAMAAGLPIVTPDKAWAKPFEIINEKDIFKAIKHFAKPAERAKAGKAARATAKMFFDRKQTLKRLRDYLIEWYEQKGASIQLPVYNPPIDAFKAVLESMENQTSRRWVAKIGIDGADLKTRRIIQDIADKDARFDIVFERDKNAGCDVTRNDIWESSRSDILINQDSDDPSDENRYGDLIEYLRKYKRAPAVSSKIEMRSIKNMTAKGSVYPQEKKATFDRLIRNNIIPNPGAAFRKSICSEVCGERPFDESLKGCSDYDFWLRLAKAGYVIDIIDRVLVTKINHPGGICAVTTKADPELVPKIRRRYV